MLKNVFHCSEVVEDFRSDAAAYYCALVNLVVVFANCFGRSMQGFGAVAPAYSVTS